MERFAPEIEEAIFEADVLGVFLLARHGQRQFFGGALDSHGPREHLDRAGRQIGVHGLRRARLYLALNRHNAFCPQRIEHRQRGAVFIGDNLRDAVMIAQIDEQNAAMVALPVNPAGKPHCLANFGRRKLCASVGSVGVHLNSCPVGGYDAKARPAVAVPFTKGIAPPNRAALTGQGRVFVKQGPHPFIICFAQSRGMGGIPPKAALRLRTAKLT